MEHSLIKGDLLKGEDWGSSPLFETQTPRPKLGQRAWRPPDQQPPQVQPRQNVTVPRNVERTSESANAQKNQPLTPSIRARTLLWFEQTQLPRLRRAGNWAPPWLHGFATRSEAEELLKGKPQGCFLLRLSESKIGFVLSYSGKDRCRHFIIKEEPGNGGYLIAGEESRHGSLQELLSFYTQNRVWPFDEMLTTPWSDSPGVPNDARKPEANVGRDAAESVEREKHLPSASEFGVPESVQSPPTHSAPEDRTGTPEYAIVRKARKKPSLTIEPWKEGAPELRVPPTRRGSAGGREHWSLDPLHIYEESPHLSQQPPDCQEQIGFYAMGSWQDIEKNKAPPHHLYSEVNLGDSRGGHHPPGRVAPTLPSRPPPAMVCCTRPQDGSFQRCSDPLMASGWATTQLSHPQKHVSLTSESIYEQIPERPATITKPCVPSFGTSLW